MIQDYVSPVTDNRFKCNFVFAIMPHHIKMRINTLYDYAIINY